MKPARGIAAQFARLLVTAGLGCVLLFLGLQMVLQTAVQRYFARPEALDRATQRQIADFADYAAETGLAGTDTQTITRWADRHRFTMLELYRDGQLLYTSFVPSRPAGGHRPGFASDLPRTTLPLADGDAQLILFVNLPAAYRTTGTGILAAGCVGLFLALFLLGCRRIVRYICLLSTEIQAMEGGELEHPITVQGQDELTALAASLDSMRVTLRRQQQEEAQAAAKVKSLITEMSHDLRTPLTTLLLYTEILREGKYQTEAQRDNCLAKIDQKARQIKQLSDNLFEYALVTRDSSVVLEPPAPFSCIFEQPLADLIDSLQQRGFACAVELGDGDPLLAVRGEYLRRILDNIASNILKYADPASPVTIRAVQGPGWAGLSVCNRPAQTLDGTDSTHVGLSSIQTMMENMHAVTHIENTPQRFCITLQFPVQ